MNTTLGRMLVALWAHDRYGADWPMAEAIAESLVQPMWPIGSYHDLDMMVRAAVAGRTLAQSK